MLTDWLMVIITGIYVVATIFICWANIKSANASKKQLEEMQRQYDEINRPNIEVELIREKNGFYGLRFINHGTVVANHVKIIFDSDFLNSIKETGIKSVLQSQSKKECTIGVRQYYKLYFGCNIYHTSSPKVAAKGYITYKGTIKDYKSEFFIDLDNYTTFYSVKSEHDDWRKWMKELNANIKQLSHKMQTLTDIKHSEDDNV